MVSLKVGYANTFIGCYGKLIYYQLFTHCLISN